MTRDCITAKLKIILECGDHFNTDFNILLSMLANKSIQQFVDDYYVGSIYTFQNEMSRKIKKVEILAIAK
jgi:hypothetical protein